MSWYEDLNAMQDDDKQLQILYDRLRGALGWWDRRKLRNVHVYPSVGCSYSLNKQRIFVRMRNDKGQRYADCVLSHVLLHEMAHVLNRNGLGHDKRFHDVPSVCTTKKITFTCCIHFAVPRDEPYSTRRPVSSVGTDGLQPMSVMSASMRAAASSDSGRSSLGR